MFEHHGQQQFTATAFSPKLTTSIVQMVKDVFCGFVYAEKLDLENKEQDLSTSSEDREHRHSAGQEDLSFIYRMGSSALFSKSCTEEN